MQHGRERDAGVAALSQGGEVAPTAHGREPPGFEAAQRVVGPCVRIPIMLPGRVAGIGGIELLSRCALVDATNAERKEPLSVRPDEPGRLALTPNRKGRVR